MLYHDGEDLRELPMLARKAMLQALVDEHILNPLITVVPHTFASRTMYETIVEDGGEGVILKDMTAPYGEGWVKVKRFSTLDVIVTGFTDGAGKYIDQIGAACVSVYNEAGILVEIGRVSGMTDEVRSGMSTNREKWLGKVIEIAAHAFGKERLRHPRFKRARWDADPAHATLEKIFRDLSMAAQPPQKQQELRF